MRKKIGVLFFTILICFSACIPVCAFEPGGTVQYRGVDVSEWQGEINWQQVKNAGIEVAYIRASVGAAYRDARVFENYAGAKENGILVGFYHYLTARTVEEARMQAEFFVNVIARTTPECRLAMDFESFGNLSIDEINEISVVFLETVRERSGREVCIYSDVSNARNVFSERLTQYPLWVAEYGVERPAPNGKWQTWAGFQFTDRGRISGINTNVDRDVFTNILVEETPANLPGGNVYTPPREILYRVRRGDTLFGLARRYDTTVAELVGINDLNNPNLIFVGQQLKIIPGLKSDGVTQEQRILVRRGDTLFAIAREFRTTVSAIVRRNNIKNPNLIFVGQTLIIP